MQKKIFFTLMLTLISSNSLLAMDESEEKVTSLSPLLRKQDIEVLERANESLEASFAPTTTVKIKEDLWAHVYVTRTALRAKGNVWTTKTSNEGSERVNVGQITISLDWGMHEGKTEYNRNEAEAYLYATGGAFTRAKATGWIIDPAFGTKGPFVAKTKH